MWRCVCSALCASTTVWRSDVGAVRVYSHWRAAHSTQPTVSLSTLPCLGPVCLSILGLLFCCHLYVRTQALHISLHISFEYCDDENILKYFLKVRRRKIIVIRPFSFFLHLCSQAAPYVTCWWGLCVLSWFWFTCWWGSSPINWTTWTAWDWAKCPCVADRGYTTTECWSRLAGGEEQVSQGQITMM